MSGHDNSITISAENWLHRDCVNDGIGGASIAEEHSGRTMHRQARNNASTASADCTAATTKADCNLTGTENRITHEVEVNAVASQPPAMRNQRSDMMAFNYTSPIAQSEQLPAAPTSALNVNGYASKKSLAQGMLDLALLAANAAQLKFVLAAGESHPFYQLLLVLIVTSICLQVMQVITCLVLGLILDITKVDEQHKANIINNISVIIIVVVVALNVVISAFDMKTAPDIAMFFVRGGSPAAAIA